MKVLVVGIDPGEVSRAFAEKFFMPTPGDSVDLIGWDPGQPIGGVAVEWSEVDGVIVSREIPAKDIYASPEDGKAYIAFVSPDDERDAVFQELSRPTIYTGDEKIFTGEIGRFNSGFRFVPVDELLPNIKRLPKQKAQWKRERSGRR